MRNPCSELKKQNKKENTVFVYSSNGSTRKKPNDQVRPMLIKQVLSITVWRLKFVSLLLVDEMLCFEFKRTVTQCFRIIRANMKMLIITIISMGRMMPKVIEKPLNQQLLFVRLKYKNNFFKYKYKSATHNLLGCLYSFQSIPSMMEIGSNGKTLFKDNFQNY